MKTPIRRTPITRSAAMRLDVTRLEHENLYEQVSELIDMVRRLETELRRQNARIANLEHELARRQGRSPSGDSNQ